MRPELMCWITTHRCSEYVIHAYDDVLGELYVEIGGMLYLVNYSDIAQVKPFVTAAFCNRVLNQGQVLGTPDKQIWLLSA